MRWYERFFQRKLTEKRLDAELRFHLEQRIADLVGSGMAREEARRQARLELGGLDQVKEECRDVGGSHIIEAFIQDIRYGLRQLRRNPGFTAIAVLTLALGIGANTAVFSVVNSVLLQPLPYHDPERLVSIWQSYQGYTDVPVSTPNVDSWRTQNRVFEEIAAYRVQRSFTLAGQGEAQWLQGTYVTANFFGTLGVEPLLGRGFDSSEDQPVARPEVILTHALWAGVFHSDPGIVGKIIDLDGRGYTVLGIMPTGFRFPSWTDFWLPLGQMGKDELTSRVYHPLNVIARLKSGVNILRAQMEMTTINSRDQLQYPKTDEGWGVQVVSLHEQLVGTAQEALLILLAATGFVLLIACANVANLLLARAAERQKEVAVRKALGASRSRLIRQMLSESIVLALAGGALGLALAEGGLKLLPALGQGAIPQLLPIQLDAKVLAFTLITALMAGILFGLAPALRSGRLNLVSSLKATSEGSTAGFRSDFIRNLFVVTEVGLALVVLIGSGLLLRTFQFLLNVDPGFDVHNVLTARVTLLDPQYSAAGQREIFYRQLLNKVKELPGVEAAGFTDVLPLSEESNFKTRFAVEVHALSPGETYPAAELRIVYPGYFKALRIPLIQGRVFTNADFARSSAPPVIINRRLADRFFHGEDPVGKKINAGPEGPAPSWVRVIGVIGDIKEFGLAGRPKYALYFCGSNAEMYLVVKIASSPLSYSEPVRRLITKLDKSVPVSDVMTMQQRLSTSLARRRYSTVLLGVFAILGLTLSAVGISGVISYSVIRRTHEIGIRMALGAQKSDVLTMVVGQGLRLALIGVAIGIAAALAVTRFLSSMLYGVKPTDPLTFVAVSLILIAVALVACYIPARRATKVEPMVALRYE
ncbi:MAG TPA: ABC transporter permease [Terriglobia bacterium]|nr:ABC transporter permease [Terriglobia bacterium]